MRTECLGDTLAAMGVINAATHFHHPGKENSKEIGTSNNTSTLLKNDDHQIRSIPFESYKKRTTLIVKRRRFVDVVCDALAEYKYLGPNQRADLVLACRYFLLLVSLQVYHYIDIDIDLSSCIMLLYCFCATNLMVCCIIYCL